MITVMGFWGTYVVHRGEASLRDLLPDVPQLADDDAVNGERAAGGWQVAQVWVPDLDLPGTLITDLRDATGAPVLAADILDSSTAYVHAVGVRTPFWDTWLNIDSAVGYTVLPQSPFDEDGNYLGDDWENPEYPALAAATRQDMLARTLSGAAAAAAAVTWAQEAGLDPAPAPEVEATLAATEVFFEEQLYVLFQRLGLDTPPS